MARYIDADKIIEALMKNAAHYARRYCDDGELGECRGILQAKAVAERFPTEDVAPVVHGKWLPCINKCFETTHYVCSNCWCNSIKRNKTKYCHNCGAKMLEE